MEYEAIRETNMGWFSKLFECSKQHHADSKEADSIMLLSSSQDASSQCENGEIERAIVLPPTEGDENGYNANDRISQSEYEQLPRAIEESYGNGTMNEPYPYPTYLPNRICAGCNTDIGHAQYLQCLNEFWHPQCFRYRGGCNQPMSDEVSSFGGFPSHRSCYHNNYLLKCEVCYNLLPRNYDGLVECGTHRFWAQRFCASHFYDGTPECCSCERLESRGKPYTDLSDGRKICLECMGSAIMNSDQCQLLYDEIQEFFKSQNMDLDREIPLYMVEKHALNQGEGEREFNGHLCDTEIRGCFVSQSERSGKVKAKMKRHSNAIEIQLLFGLSRLLAGSVLAHEMMHAWLKNEGYQTLDLFVEEGICQAVSYLWLEAELSSGSSSNFAPASPSSSYDAPRTFGEFCKYMIESNMSPVYGGGFKAAMQAVCNYGLQMTLRHVKATASLPY